MQQNSHLKVQDKREIAKEYLKSYLSNPGRFSILVFGERGTGKSKWVNHFADKMNIHKDNIIHVSCASFTDDKTAEIELFGVKKRIFTEVTERKGVFEKAKNGVLFFDEIHTLSPRVQEKLMTTLQTEPDGEHQGKFSFYIVGDTKKQYSNTRVIFATNKTVRELKNRLLPDFYDRIAQLIVKFPSLAETQETIEYDFKKIWQQMDFKKQSEIPNLEELYKWLKRINLSGNFRDLEKIAILWHQARMMNFDSEENIFEWVKEQMQTYHLENKFNAETKYNFRKGVSKKTMEQEYRNEMYLWAKENFENNKEAERALKISRLDILKNE